MDINALKKELIDSILELSTNDFRDICLDWLGEEYLADLLADSINSYEESDELFNLLNIVKGKKGK